MKRKLMTWMLICRSPSPDDPGSYGSGQRESDLEGVGLISRFF
ncbi:hypothetical protein [Paenibacillus sp. MER TA 81-3]|nr:hypothetical protein [Paenibacillus sp. MER TA 81-3]